VSALPAPNLAAGLVEDSRVVAQPHLVRRRGRVAAKEEPVGVPLHWGGHALRRFRGRHNALGDLVPRGIEIHVRETGIAEDLFDLREVVLRGADHPSQARMRPA
jgi:hypothetical protein